MKITDEMLAQAAKEVSQVILDQPPNPAGCRHDFSPEFEQNIAALTGRIWDETEQRYI